MRVSNGLPRSVYHMKSLNVLVPCLLFTFNMGALFWKFLGQTILASIFLNKTDFIKLILPINGIDHDLSIRTKGTVYFHFGNICRQTSTGTEKYKVHFLWEKSYKFQQPRNFSSFLIKMDFSVDLFSKILRNYAAFF